MSAELGPISRAINAERRLQIALDEAQRLTNELAEARGEIAALELGNGDLHDDLERLAEQERDWDRA